MLTLWGGRAASRLFYDLRLAKPAEALNYLSRTRTICGHAGFNATIENRTKVHQRTIFSFFDPYRGGDKKIDQKMKSPALKLSVTPAILMDKSVPAAVMIVSIVSAGSSSRSLKLSVSEKCLKSI